MYDALRGAVLVFSSAFHWGLCKDRGGPIIRRHRAAARSPRIAGIPGGTQVRGQIRVDLAVSFRNLRGQFRINPAPSAGRVEPAVKASMLHSVPGNTGPDVEARLSSLG